MSTLHAWLEFTDTQTGSPRRVDLEQNTLSIGKASGDLRLTDITLSEIHAILTREREAFIIRDLGSRSGTFVNQRQVVEAELKNLDEIRVGLTVITFHIAYLSAESAARRFGRSGNLTEDEAAPGRHLSTDSKKRMLWPFAMFVHPVRFWTQALETGVFQFRRTWLLHILTAAVIIAGAYLTGGGVPLLHLGFLTFAGTLALILMAITCSVFFAFDSLPDAPHRLGQSLRFIFCVSPFLMAIQVAFLVLASRYHPKAGQYFLASIVPTLVIWVFIGAESHYAFAASFGRGLAFAITASVPWNLFMTGLMSFMV
ncbi:MAG: FHA domain-containing protein [Deltaproteobacteria bacterium]|nr:FHA domain-containing protein [Deltaproteobacteria bacterium]